MDRSKGSSAAAERGRWLAELAEAIDQALRLARESGVPRGTCVTANQIYRRLELVRSEVDALRRGGWDSVPIETDPLRTSFFPSDDPPNR